MLGDNKFIAVLQLNFINNTISLDDSFYNIINKYLQQHDSIWNQLFNFKFKKIKKIFEYLNDLSWKNKIQPTSPVSIQIIDKNSNDINLDDLIQQASGLLKHDNYLVNQYLQQIFKEIYNIQESNYLQNNPTMLRYIQNTLNRCAHLILILDKINDNDKYFLNNSSFRIATMLKEIYQRLTEKKTALLEWQKLELDAELDAAETLLKLKL